MIDLFLFIEIVWCTILLGLRPVEKAILYAGGVLASGYVSSQITPWMERTFVAPSNAAFLWLQEHINGDVESVVGQASYMPPEPASVGMTNHPQWIAYHIVSVLLYIFITGAIFAAFLAVCSLRDALLVRVQHGNSLRPVSIGLGAVCGLYVAFLTAVAIANLSWIGAFHNLGETAHASISIRLIAFLSNMIHLN